MTQPTTEGYIPFKGYKTWYKIVGEKEEPGKLPLLLLHGGPGACHDYLWSLAAMADTGRRVIFYDQIGCGLSQIGESKPEMWTVDLYVEEVDAVRQALGLDKIHLLGQSWGGMLAMEYMIRQPKGVASVTIASSPASMIQWVAEANKLREELPPEINATLLKHEAAGTTTDPDYITAMTEFYNRHVCRVVPNPEYVQRSFAKLGENPEVYNTMNGPSEFHVVGTLKTWDIINQLGKINAPTLVTSGKYDEATPLIAETVHNGIPGSEWVLFENSSHMAHVEEADRYLQILSAFIARHEP
ncbi:MAG: proline iminopeptidase-family hydrolase [Chloroflexi bacterium]|nr:proline iminopeptidase-family hydrolase [Chloroflexota bacterium]MCC6891591.1 proline iminopeptidase-family hydrolase [Anaerolineae bacterium]